jgi:hypothetical protein
LKETGLRSCSEQDGEPISGKHQDVRNCKEIRKERLWKETRHWKLLCLDAGKRNDAEIGRRKRRTKTGKKKR